MKQILFNTEMVKAILEGRKTQTRRIVPKNFEISQIPEFNANGDENIYPFRILDKKLLNVYDTHDIGGCFNHYIKYGYKVGDTLCVREPAKIISPPVETCKKLTFKYLADNKTTEIYLDDDFDYSKKWIQRCQGVPNGCIKEMARIFLKVTKVRVERLQDITLADMICEGINHLQEYSTGKVVKPFTQIKREFINLWNSTAKDGYKYEDNPPVFIYEFERIENKDLESLN